MTPEQAAFLLSRLFARRCEKESAVTTRVLTSRSCRTNAITARIRRFPQRHSNSPGILRQCDIWFLDGFLTGKFRDGRRRQHARGFQGFGRHRSLGTMTSSLAEARRSRKAWPADFWATRASLLRNLQFSCRDVPAVHASPHDSSSWTALRLLAAHGRESAEHLRRKF